MSAVTVPCVLFGLSLDHTITVLRWIFAVNPLNTVAFLRPHKAKKMNHNNSSFKTAFTSWQQFPSRYSSATTLFKKLSRHTAIITPSE